MPKRPPEHITAGRARAAVEAVIAEAGFAVEVVKNDYGEDLLVQTSHAGKMDASRMWLQVKGTRDSQQYRRATGSFAYSVPIDHAIRWLRSGDLVIVVLWDVVNRTGWYAVVADQVDEWDSAEAGTSSLVVRFSPKHVFDSDAACSLSWRSRIMRYRALLLDASDVDREREAMDDAQNEGSAPGEVRPIHGVTTLLALDFLRTLGMVRELNTGHFALVDDARNMFGKHVREETADIGDLDRGAREELVEASGSTS